MNNPSINGAAVMFDNFKWCKNLVKVTGPYVTEVLHQAFRGCVNLTEAIFPRVTGVYGEAFDYCENLVSTTLPRVRLIKRLAFIHCDALRHITLHPDAVAEPHAFIGCTTLALFARCAGFELNTGDYLNPNNYLNEQLDPTVGITRYLKWRCEYDVQQQSFQTHIQLLTLSRWYLPSSKLVWNMVTWKWEVRRARPVDPVTAFMFEHEDVATYILLFFERGENDLRGASHESLLELRLMS